MTAPAALSAQHPAYPRLVPSSLISLTAILHLQSATICHISLKGAHLLYLQLLPVGCSQLVISGSFNLPATETSSSPLTQTRCHPATTMHNTGTMQLHHTPTANCDPGQTGSKQRNAPTIEAPEGRTSSQTLARADTGNSSTQEAEVVIHMLLTG